MRETIKRDELHR